MKLALALDLSLESLEEIALKLCDLSAAQAGHMNVITLRSALVKVLLALHVHQIEFVDQAVALQQLQGAIDRYPIDPRVDLACVPENLCGIQVLLSGLHNAQNCAALVSQA